MFECECIVTICPALVDGCFLTELFCEMVEPLQTTDFIQ